MGCGSVADFGHGPAILATPGLNLYAVYDPDFDRAVKYQKKFGATHAFIDRNLFFNCGIDAVTITAPAPVHYDLVLEASKFHLPVLCEKPIAMDDDQAEAMIIAMANANAPLGIGYCYRFSPVALKIKSLVEQNAIGKIRSLRMIYIWNLHGIYEYDAAGKPFYSPQRAERMREGGPMVDCGVHDIDLARWWLKSEIESYHGEGAWVEDYEAPDHMYLHLRHEDGTLTTIEMSFTYTHTSKDPISYFSYQLIGSEGLIRYDRDIGLFEIRTREKTERLPWSHEKNFPGMYEEWERVLTTNSMGHMPTGQDGLIATKIARDATNEVISRRPKSLGPPYDPSVSLPSSA